MSQAEDILNEGDLFFAIVEEIVQISTSSQELIVGYHGHLFRVKNSSGKNFKIGDRLHLLVLRTNPVELKLYSNSNVNQGSLNRFV